MPRTGALQGPAPAPIRPTVQPRHEPRHEESSLEHHLEAALETLRPSRAMTAFKKASALTRWIILIFVVGLATAAVVGLAFLALFTLVDSSV